MANEGPSPVQATEDRIDHATGAPHQGPKYAEREDERGDVGAMEREQRRESADAWAGPGMPATSAGQWKGLVTGSLLGGAIGLVLFLPLALIEIGGLSTVGRLLLVGITGALCGGTAGALYFGGRVPELEGETVDGDGRPSNGSTPKDPSTDARGR